MSNDATLESVERPYPVTVTAGLDGNNSPYFLYFDKEGVPLSSPLIIPKHKKPYDGIRFTQTGDKATLRLWAAATHTLEGTKPPQGDNLLLARKGRVSIRVNPGTQRGTVLIFEQLDRDGAVVNLVPTPDPRTQNDG
jgi:hypothetical protein